MPSKLLIADDNTTIKKILGGIFPPEEFAITFANNGEEALAKARRVKPDLIIADINMPLKNGFEVCEEVKKDPLLKGTPVLLLFEILDDFDEDEGRRVGADGLIVKPFQANAVIRKVREALALTDGTSPLEKAARKTVPLEQAMGKALDEAFDRAFPRKEAVKEEEEEVLELVEVVEEPPSAPPPHGKEDEFVLENPVEELGAESKQEHPEDGEEVVKEENEVRKGKGFDERFVQNFAQPIFKATEEDLRRIRTLEKGLEGVHKEAVDGLGERLAEVLSQELTRIMEEVRKETIPKLLQQIKRYEKTKEDHGRLSS